MFIRLATGRVGSVKLHKPYPERSGRVGLVMAMSYRPDFGIYQGGSVNRLVRFVRRFPIRSAETEIDNQSGGDTSVR